MGKSFIQTQLAALKSIVSLEAKSPINKSLDLYPSFFKGKDIDRIYKHWSERAHVRSYPAYIEWLRKIFHYNGSADLVFTSKKIYRTNKLKAVSYSYDGEPFPCSEKFLKKVDSFERKLFQGSLGNYKKRKGKVLTLIGNPSLKYSDGLPMGDYRTILTSERNSNYLPDLDMFIPVGKSRYQRMHAYCELLEKEGKNISTIVARPSTLLEIGQILSQREGRVVKFKELCPNLSLFVATDAGVDTYYSEMEILFSGLDMDYLEYHFHPSGVLAYQIDPKLNNSLKLSDELGTFYEFIPVEDVYSDGRLKGKIRRFHAGQVEVGKDYRLVVTTPTGMRSVATPYVVTIKSLEPFLVEYKRPIYKLNHYGENISMDMVESVIAGINKESASYGFFIREYLLADDLVSKRALWILEISRPLSTINKEYFQSVANTLHIEMGFKNPDYRQQVLSVMPQPDVIFVPTGTFSLLNTRLLTMHIDLSPKAPMAWYIIKNAPDKKIFKARKM